MFAAAIRCICVVLTRAMERNYMVADAVDQFVQARSPTCASPFMFFLTCSLFIGTKMAKVTGNGRIRSPGMDVFVTRAMVFDIISFVYATCAIDRCTHMGFIYIYIYTPVTNTHMKKDPEMILQEIMALER